MGKNMSFVPFLQSTAGAAPSASGSASLITFLPIILIFVIFYFFMIRPQNKKQKETERMINALKKGDKVITIGGIHGTVSSVKEKTIIVKVDDNCKIEFNRTAISSVELSDEEKAKLAEAENAKKGLKKSKKSSETEASADKAEKTESVEEDK